MNRRWQIHRLAIQAALAIGAVVFSFPFLWMISTSVKLDRELFRGHLDLRPEKPNVRPRSPYYETRRFEPDPPTELQARVLESVFAEKLEPALAAVPQRGDQRREPAVLLVDREPARDQRPEQAQVRER
ncbi:MAG: hypothetical protein RMJ35_00270, partial [Phycisphaerales bacterium]|nr:hypothetical protein [Phycisphaerales bacterium]